MGHLEEVGSVPAVCDGVGKGIGEDVSFGVDLAAGVEEGEGV